MNVNKRFEKIEEIVEKIKMNNSLLEHYEKMKVNETLIDNKGKAWFSERYDEYANKADEIEDEIEKQKENLAKQYASMLEVYRMQCNYSMITDMLKDIEKDYNFNMTNLKLHDVSYFAYENSISESAFEIFTECEFDMFREYLKEKAVEYDHLGRTSSLWFYIENYQDMFEGIAKDRDDEVIPYVVTELFNNVHIDEFEVIEKIFTSELELYEIVMMIMEDNNIDYLDDPYDVVQMLQEAIDNIASEIDNMSDDLFDIEVYLKEVKEVYDWLDEYKENQVEYFKDFLEANDHLVEK